MDLISSCCVVSVTFSYSLLNSQGFDQPLDPRARNAGGRGGMGQGGPNLRPNRDYQGSVSGPAGRPGGPRASLDRNVENVVRLVDLFLPKLCELSVAKHVLGIIIYVVKIQLTDSLTQVAC